ncbi:MAG: iron chelate uptake ABC transporter family permease subunit [Spirochaetes bacterium]|nr:iron chelate uptake ABC transporter family permease subunit [Spirochaetota bacterium]
MRYRTAAVLLAMVILAFAADLALGSVRVPLDDLLAILTGRPASRPVFTQIVLSLRLPKALTAIVAGAALAVSGLEMQTLFRNPLAGPFVLGVNAGASLGVAIVVLVFGGVGAAAMLPDVGLSGDLGVIAAAMIGAAAVMVLVVAVGRLVRSIVTLLVLGLLIGYAASAAVSMLMHFSAADRIQAFVVWTFGSFGSVGWSRLGVMSGVVGVGLVIAGALVKPLNALLLGESQAVSLGVRPARVRTLLVLSTALLAGAVTAFCGPITFIGVAVPHLVRSRMQSADHRRLIPAVIAVGALVALLADIVSGLPGSDARLPLNAVTSLLGAPVVALAVMRAERLSAHRGAS